MFNRFKKVFEKYETIYFKRKSDGNLYIANNKDVRDGKHLCYRFDLETEEAIQNQEWIEDSDLLFYDFQGGYCPDDPVDVKRHVEESVKPDTTITCWCGYEIGYKVKVKETNETGKIVCFNDKYQPIVEINGVKRAYDILEITQYCS